MHSIMLMILASVLALWPTDTSAQIIRGGGGSGGGVTGWPTVSTEKEVTWANALANALKIGDGTDAWAIYRDATDGLQFVCVVAGVANDCNYIRKLASGKNFQIQNSSGVSIGTVTESTGAWTNLKLDAEGSGNILTIKRYLWLPFAACQAGTAWAIWDLPCSNAPTAAG